nr:DUF983 domain-containing protein [Ketogulonicigenium robustum]
MTTAVRTQVRPTGRSIARGWRGRCPACGEGRIFSGYLKVADHCPHCNEALYHQRADDGPAYLTILIVGHLMAIAMHITWSVFRPAPVVMACTFSVGVIALALYLLPRMKGAMIGLQWAKRMHGFGAPHAKPEH